MAETKSERASALEQVQTAVIGYFGAGALRSRGAALELAVRLCDETNSREIERLRGNPVGGK